MKRGVIFIVGGVFLVLILVVVLISRNNNQAPTAVTLKIWSPFDEGKVYRDMAQPFLDAHPNVNLDFRFVEAADAKDYEAKVVNAIAAGSGPDIWLIRNDWLPKHETKITPSNGLIRWSKDRKVTEATAFSAFIGEAAVKQNSRAGQIYGAPLAVDSLALYINRKVVNQVINELNEQSSKNAEVFQAAPLTWAKLEAWSRLLTKPTKDGFDRSGIALGTLGNTYAATDVLTALLYQKQGSLFTADETQAALHLAKTIDGQTVIPGQQAIDFYSSFARPGDKNYSWNSSVGDPVKALVDGKVAMILGYSSLVKDIRKLNNDIDTISVYPLPQQTDQQVKDGRVDFAAYWSHVVDKTSAQPALAWQFLQGLYTNENYRVYSKATAKPTVNSLQNQPAIILSSSDMNDTTVFATQALTTTQVYKVEWQQVDQVLQDMINQSTVLRQSPQAVVDTATEALKKLLPTP